MKMFFSRIVLCLIILTAVTPGFCLYAEEAGGSGLPEADPASYVGLTLEALFKQLGTPKSVYAVRGIEPWQDDVVFVYPTIEIYLFRDRVWQVCPVSVYNMKIGDSINAIKTLMGDPLVGTEKYLLYQLPSQAWPMMLRINLGKEGRAASFFIYRSDF